MIEIILKNKITKSKIEMLLKLLKSWNVDAEFVETKEIKQLKNKTFSLSKGIWKDAEVDANQLRKEAWAIKR